MPRTRRTANVLPSFSFHEVFSLSVDPSTTTASSTRRTALRAVTALFASVALLLSGILTIAPAAHAVFNSSISGTLLDASGDPVAYESVELRQLVGTNDSEYIDDLQTDEDGAYEFTDLEDGVYTLESGWFGDYTNQFYGGNHDRHATSAKIVVGANQAVTANMRLTLGHSISGTVRNSSGAPLEDVRVRAYRWITDDGDPYWESEEDDHTSVNGSYSIDGLLNGVWTVRAYDTEDNYLGYYHGGDYERDNAARIVLNGANKTGVNFAMKKGGVVNGVITTPSGSPADGGSLGWCAWTPTRGASCTTTGGRGLHRGGRLVQSPACVPGDLHALVRRARAVRPRSTWAVSRARWRDALHGEAGCDHDVNTKLSAKPFVVPSTTKVSLSKSTRAYGTASTATVAVSGKGAVAGAVTLTAGAKAIGTKAVVGGKAAFTLPANLAVGKHAVRATFTTTGVLQSSRSAAVLTVTKAVVEGRREGEQEGLEALGQGHGQGRDAGWQVRRQGRQDDGRQGQAEEGQGHGQALEPGRTAVTS